MRVAPGRKPQRGILLEPDRGMRAGGGIDFAEQSLERPLASRSARRPAPARRAHCASPIPARSRRHSPPSPRHRRPGRAGRCPAARDRASRRSPRRRSAAPTPAPRAPRRRTSRRPSPRHRCPTTPARAPARAGRARTRGRRSAARAPRRVSRCAQLAVADHHQRRVEVGRQLAEHRDQPVGALLVVDPPGIDRAAGRALVSPSSAR